MLKRYYPILAAVLVFGELCHATVITALNPSYSAVSTAVAAAAPGDTVQVLAGVAVWTNNLMINKDILLIGAGIDRTIIIDEESRATGNDRLINWMPVAGGAVRLSGFTFQGGTVNTSNPWF